MPSIGPTLASSCINDRGAEATTIADIWTNLAAPSGKDTQCRCAPLRPEGPLVPIGLSSEANAETILITKQQSLHNELRVPQSSAFPDEHTTHLKQRNKVKVNEVHYLQWVGADTMAVSSASLIPATKELCLASRGSANES